MSTRGDDESDCSLCCRQKMGRPPRYLGEDKVLLVSDLFHPTSLAPLPGSDAHCNWYL